MEEIYKNRNINEKLRREITMETSKEKNKIALILGVVCFILIIGICTQIRSIDSITEKEGISISENSELIDEKFRQKQILKDTIEDFNKANLEYEQVRAKAAESNDNDKYIESQIKNSDKLLGLTEVKGPGIIIKLDDNREVNVDEVLVDPSSLIVHEGDLLQITNELFNAGADAISINDKRIVSTTAILCDGNIIRINDEVVGVPIEIKAIGYPESFYALNRPQGYLALMKRDGVKVSIEKKDEIIIPKYEGVYQYEYIAR